MPVKLKCWGKQERGQESSQEHVWVNVLQVQLSFSHSCALKQLQLHSMQLQESRQIERLQIMPPDVCSLQHVAYDGARTDPLQFLYPEANLVSSGNRSI